MVREWKHIGTFGYVTLVLATTLVSIGSIVLWSVWGMDRFPRTLERTIYNDTGEQVTLTITCIGCPNDQSYIHKIPPQLRQLPDAVSYDGKDRSDVYEIRPGRGIAEYHFWTDREYQLTARTPDGRLVYCRDFRGEDFRTAALTVTAGDIQCQP
jgi:hypothetical protein